MSDSSPSYIDGPSGRLAYAHVAGAGPTLVWLGGFRSDMAGTKALYLDQWAHEHNRAYLRFDYSGHGQSEGDFEDGCLSSWTDDAEAMINAATDGPLVLIGSSMGAWVACLLARRLASRIKGAVFIAPAPDFTEALIWPSMDSETRETLMREGRIEEETDYADEPSVITKKLIEDGRDNLILHEPVTIDGPVRILQGMADPDVPYAHAFRLAEALTSDDVMVVMTKSGDHRLSTDADLQRLAGAVESVVRG
ncbi:MAG: alpha/beta hydrolase [Pseudomonadota bacterium]